MDGDFIGARTGTGSSSFLFQGQGTCRNSSLKLDFSQAVYCHVCLAGYHTTMLPVESCNIIASLIIINYGLLKQMCWMLWKCQIMWLMYFFTCKQPLFK